MESSNTSNLATYQLSLLYDSVPESHALTNLSEFVMHSV